MHYVMLSNAHLIVVTWIGLKFPGPSHPLIYDTCVYLIYDTHDIIESFQKPAIRLVFFWCKSGMTTIKLQSTAVS